MIASVRAALDGGVTFFDTAQAYGDGRSEEILGRIVRGCQENVVIATKVGWAGEVSPAMIRDRLRASLRRLRREYLDIYLLHSPSASQATEPVVAEMLALKAKGLIRAWGIAARSHWSRSCGRWVPALAGDFSEIHAVLQWEPPDVVEIVYSLLDRRARHQLLSHPSMRGVGVIARNVLASGLITGAHKVGARFPSNDFRSELPPSWLDGVLQAGQTFRRKAAPLNPSQTAVAFTLSEPAIDVAIVGVKQPRDVTEAIAAARQVPLAPGLVVAVRAIFDAPDPPLTDFEAYAHPAASV